MEGIPQKESISDALKKYKEANEQEYNENKSVTSNSISKFQQFNKESFEATMSKETDPDLMTTFERIKLPSGGLHYANGLSEVDIEYMTSKDEDLLTTPSLLENGLVFDILLKRKIKTKNVNIDDLLSGDRNAVLLFLRTSSYGSEYTVQVTDPRSGIPFNDKVDLLKLKYKEITEFPDEQGLYTVEIPMRKKIVKFRLLTSGEDTKIQKNAEAIKDAYNEEFSQYQTLRLKSSIVSINDKTDKSYINRFVDAMPALDAYTIRRKIIDVTPDIDTKYEFMAKDGYKFYANLSLGIDFFFPNS